MQKLALFLLLSCAACGQAAATGGADAAVMPPADAGVVTQCQFRDLRADVTTGPGKNARYAGQLHLAAKSGTTEVVGVLMGPAVESGVDQRFSVSGDVNGTQVALDVLLPDARVLVLTGTLDKPLSACSGAMQGTLSGPGPSDTGTWSAKRAESPPADAVSCVNHGADPLVCGLYVP